MGRYVCQQHETIFCRKESPAGPDRSICLSMHLLTLTPYLGNAGDQLYLAELFAKFPHVAKFENNPSMLEGHTSPMLTLLGYCFPAGMLPIGVNAASAAEASMLAMLVTHCMCPSWGDTVLIE